jgi:hypothetical protein
MSKRLSSLKEVNNSSGAIGFALGRHKQSGLSQDYLGIAAFAKTG